jgi:hypothetical protein
MGIENPATQTRAGFFLAGPDRGGLIE